MERSAAHGQRWREVLHMLERRPEESSPLRLC
jgi:hypothetical protein